MSRSLLVITSSFPRGARDVAGHFVEQWCRALVDCGWEIDVLCWRGPGAMDREVCRGLAVRFVPYAWRSGERLFFGAGAPENLEGNPARALLAVPAAASMVGAALRAMGQKRYDAVVGHWLVPGGAIARFVGGLVGVPSAVVGHSGGVHLLRSLPGEVARPLVRWLTDGLTTVPTQRLCDQLQDLGAGSGVQVAPMGFAPSSAQIDESPATPKLQLGFLGRLVPIKGLPVVFRAVERLRGEGLDVGLTIVGDGPCRRRWEDEAGEGVRFAGTKFGDEKWELLRRWDALVMPSKPRANGRHEGLPVSLLEASSVGTPPLVSGVPGVEDWLARPQHQLVAAGDVEAWTKAIRWVQSLDGRQSSGLGRATRSSVRDLAWPKYGQWWDRWLHGLSR